MLNNLLALLFYFYTNIFSIFEPIKAKTLL